MDSSSSERSNLFSGPIILGGILLLFIIVVIIIFVRRGSMPSLSMNFPFSESFENDDENNNCSGLDKTERDPNDTIPLASEENGNVTNQMLNEDEDTNPLGNSVPKDCFPHKMLDSKDLLPSQANTKWAQSNPSGQGSLSDKNFLNAGFHVGMNTVGQSLRNSNLQLRSEPANPQTKVSPWLQSTIDPDLNRKPLEIGADE
jgi:hypothetical protein